MQQELAQQRAPKHRRSKMEEKNKPEDKKIEETPKENQEIKTKPGEISKKEEATAIGKSIHASKKHCMYICSFIKNKPIDQAIKELNEVILFKRAIPFKGEIPHRKGMMSGRYPIRTCAKFITMLKGLKGNVIVNKMDLEKTRISYASASWAARRMKRNNAQTKSTNLILKAKETIK